MAYTKPLGQRAKKSGGRFIHDDAKVVAQILGQRSEDQIEMAVPLPSGRVEKEVFDLHTDELIAGVRQGCRTLQGRHDIVIVESMGHVAAGSCLGLSAADVARSIEAKVLLISGGGIGSAIDDISLCGRFITAGGADLMGVIVNKVWPEKYTRVKAATTRGLKNLGIRSFGTVPYEEILASPTVGQVAEQLDSEILCGAAGLDNRVGKILIAAMEPDHMVPYLEDRALVITPGDRSGNVLAILATHMLSRGAESPVSGVILTGGFRPAQWVVDLLAGSRLPVILCSDDTYTVAAELHRKVFKITPDDKERIESAPTLVSQHVDTDGILESLGG